MLCRFATIRARPQIVQHSISRFCATASLTIPQHATARLNSSSSIYQWSPGFVASRFYASQIQTAVERSSHQQLVQDEDETVQEEAEDETFGDKYLDDLEAAANSNPEPEMLAFEAALRQKAAVKAAYAFRDLKESTLRQVTTDRLAAFLQILSLGRGRYAKVIKSTAFRNNLMQVLTTIELSSRQNSDIYTSLVMLAVFAEDFDLARQFLPQATSDFENTALWLDSAFEPVLQALESSRNFKALQNKVRLAQEFLATDTNKISNWTPVLLHAFFVAQISVLGDRHQALFSDPLPFNRIANIDRSIFKSAALPQTYDLLVQGYLEYRNFALARKVLQLRADAGHHPDESLYLAVLKGYKRLGVQENILAEIRSDFQALGLVEDVRVLNALIALQCFALNPTAAWHTFQSGFNLYPHFASSSFEYKPKPNNETFAILLRGIAAKDASFRKYRMHLHKCMEQSQTIFDEQIVFAELEVALARKLLQRASKIIEFLGNRELPNPFTFEINLNLTKPSLRMINAMFKSTLSQLGPEEGLRFLIDSKERYQILPNSITVSIWVEWVASQQSTNSKKIVDAIRALRLSEIDPLISEWSINAVLSKIVRKEQTQKTKPQAESRAIQVKQHMTASEDRLRSNRSPSMQRQLLRDRGSVTTNLSRLTVTNNKRTPGYLWRIIDQRLLKANLKPLPVHIQILLSSYLNNDQYIGAFRTLKVAETRFNLHKTAQLYALIMARLIETRQASTKNSHYTKLVKLLDTFKITWNSTCHRIIAHAWSKRGKLGKVADNLSKADKLDGKSFFTSHKRLLAHITSQGILFNARMNYYIKTGNAKIALLAQTDIRSLLVSLVSSQSQANEEHCALYAVSDGPLYTSIKRSHSLLQHRLDRMEGDEQREFTEKALKTADLNRTMLQAARQRHLTALDSLVDYIKTNYHTPKT